MDARVHWVKKRNCWRILELSDRAREFLRGPMRWPTPRGAFDVAQDEGCEVLYVLQNAGYEVIYEKKIKRKRATSAKPLLRARARHHATKENRI